jgi:hypothetical protein
MRIKGFTLICLFGLFTTIFQSCKCRRESEIPKIGKVEKEKIALKCNIQRFEKELFEIKIDSVANYVAPLRAKYGEFFDIFNYKIALLGPSKDKQYPERLKEFLTNRYMFENYKMVMKTYPDLKDLNEKLASAFAIYKGYFPEKHIPHLYSCISGWNQSIVTSDTILGIALDKYLGRNCDFYENLRLSGNEGFAKYMRYTMQHEYIVPDCMKAWGYTTFEFKDSANCLLNHMLYEGKMVYFVKKMLPDEQDTIIFGFTPAQLKWCTSNSEQMWTDLVANKRLFSTNNLTIRKFVYPAPFTSFFPKESPGRAAVWLGYKIVSDYMKSNSNITLSQLMQETDYQKILRKSNFKP